MPNTHDAPQIDLHLGPLRVFLHSVFVHYQRWPEPLRAGHPAPLAQPGTTYEDEEPWRSGHAVAFRVPYTRHGLVLGYWDIPDPARTESSLWDTDDAQAMVPGVTAEQVKHWPRPARVTDLEGTPYADTEGVSVTGYDEDDSDTYEVDSGVVDVIPWGS